MQWAVRAEKRRLIHIFHPTLHRIGFTGTPSLPKGLPLKRDFSPLAQPLRGFNCLCGTFRRPALRAELAPVRSYPVSGCSDFPLVCMLAYSEPRPGGDSSFRCALVLCTRDCYHTLGAHYCGHKNQRSCGRAVVLYTSFSDSKIF